MAVQILISTASIIPFVTLQKQTRYYHCNQWWIPDLSGLRQTFWGVTI